MKYRTIWGNKSFRVYTTVYRSRLNYRYFTPNFLTRCCGSFIFNFGPINFIVEMKIFTSACKLRCVLSCLFYIFTRLKSTQFIRSIHVVLIENCHRNNMLAFFCQETAVILCVLHNTQASNQLYLCVLCLIFFSRYYLAYIYVDCSPV